MSSKAHRVGLKLLGSGVPYAKALQVQNHVVKLQTSAATDSSPLSELDGVLLLLQHPPTFTGGRRVRDTDLTEGKRLRALGADYFETMRGGQTTFHGPGQLVGYPILNLQRLDIGVRAYVEKLEQFLIDTCRQYGIEAGVTGDTGVWIQDRKIAALGIHVTRHISSHGFALNCNTDLSWFEHIVPCGIQDKQVTSITNELALQAGTSTVSKESLHPSRVVTVADAIPIVTQCFSQRFGVSLCPLKQISQQTDDEIDRMLSE